MNDHIHPWRDREEYERLQGLMHEREFVIDQSNEAEYVGTSIGLLHGQSAKVILNADGEHATVGAVHVSLTKAGRLVVGVEAPPEMVVKSRVVRRRLWRFYDYWRFDREKRDNFIRPESEWPTAPTLIEDDDAN